MPNHSRLQGLLFILCVAIFCGNAWAMSNYAPVKPANQPPSTDASTNTPEGSATANVDGQSVDVPLSDTGAPVTESKAEVRKLGNNQCNGNANNAFQKTLLVTAFPRSTPFTANAGALSDVDHQLPQLLSQQLIEKHSALVPIQLTEGLPSSAISSDHLLAQQIQKLARNQHTQLVLTGEVIDMSMAHPEATYNPGLYTRFVNGLFDSIGIKNHFDKRERLFSFRVDLRDGFTGQTLFNKRYDTYGVWGLTQHTGFGTPLFWKSDYGQQIKGLVKMASKEVGQVIQCQPYIAQIDSRPGQTQILLQGGANNGLRTGDTLALYQMIVQGSETTYDQHQVRLVNRNAAIELREVFPSHSVGVVSGTTFLTGQFLAVAP
ncbi:MAG: flagella assembly protein FlgT middle domain-containing protein [Cellvibrio sp.]